MFIKLDLGFHLFGVGEDRVDIDNKKEEGRGLRPLEAGIRLLQTSAARLSSNCPSHNLARLFFSNYPNLNLDSF